MLGLIGTRNRLRVVMLTVVDAWAWVVALGAATATRLSIAHGEVRWRALLLLALVAVVANMTLARTPQFHPARTKRGSLDDAATVMTSWCCISPVVLFCNYFLLGRPVPTLAAVLGLPIALLIMLGARIVWRLAYRALIQRDCRGDHLHRVIVFGAGDGGEQIIRAMKEDPHSIYEPVAVLDDRKTRRTLHGVPTLGTRQDIARVAAEQAADILLVAIPSAGSDLVAELDELGRQAGLEVRVLPKTSELLGLPRVGDIRELTEADLLGRTEVHVDLEGIADMIAGRRILVTGAGGSIGSELSRQIHQLSPAKLYMLDRDESALHALQLSIEGRALLDTPQLIVADIRDRERIDELFGTLAFDVVFHAAALKHLTLLEGHPAEGVKTNVVGTANVLAAAHRNDVELFVNVSTDKAANPTSVLGATKLLAERLTARTAELTGRRYVSVRFGNVLGSRGSVLPTFKAQIELGGPVTVTHRDVTRFFMTIPEAVRLVLQAGAIGRPGEIMVLDMGTAVKILDVAERLIRQSGKRIEIQYTGLRQGEKLHEDLIAEREIGVTREHERITHTAGSVAIDVDELRSLPEPGRSVAIAAATQLDSHLSHTDRPKPAQVIPV